MRILILGANGFIGRRIVARAVEHHGPGAVVACVRRSAGAERFPAGAAQIVVDATDAAALIAAGPATHVISSVAGSNRAIVGAARSLAAYLDRFAETRLIHLSSVAVYGARDGVVREDDRPGIGADGYARAKIAAENILAAAHRERAIFLRPALVYGPGSWLWTERIARLLTAGRLGDLGIRGEGICNLVHIDDVVSAAVSACSKAQAVGRAFNLAAPSPPSWNGYLRDFARALDVPFRRIGGSTLAVERLLAYPLRLMELGGKRAHIRTPVPVTPGLVRLFGQTVWLDSSATPILIDGWRDYTQAIEESAAWFARRSQ